MTLPPLAAWLPELSTPVWWGVLTTSVVLAAGHLASMLSTAWGDRATKPKSFLFSVACHVALLSAVVALKPTLDRMLGETGTRPVEQERRFQIGSLSLDASETPAPDRVPEPWRSELTPTPRALERSAAPDQTFEEPNRDRDRPRDRSADFSTPLETAERPLPDASPSWGAGWRPGNRPGRRGGPGARPPGGVGRGGGGAGGGAGGG
ncbi:MAG: hypothetical protein AAF907_13550, partial [Planctomycetota bacterium]